MKIVHIGVGWLFLLAVGGALAVTGAPGDAIKQSDYEERSSIRIQGDGDLGEDPLEMMLPGYDAPDNGVRSGSGTSDDPFIIEEWSIEYTGAGDGPAVWIEATSLHLVIRDLRVWTVAPENHQGHAILLVGVENVVLERVQFEGFYLPLLVDHGSDVEVRDLELDYGRLDFRDSTDLVLKDLSMMGEFVSLSLHRSTGLVKDVTMNQTTDDGIVASGIMQGAVYGGISVWHSIDCEDDGRWSRFHMENVRVVSYEANAGLKVSCRGTVRVTESSFGGSLYGIMMAGGELEVHDSDFTGNEVGVLIEEGSCPCDIERSNFYGNEIHVKSLSTANTDATNNWWGLPDGPAEGSVIGAVEYEPWLTEGTGVDVRESSVPAAHFLAILLAAFVLFVWRQPRGS